MENALSRFNNEKGQKKIGIARTECVCEYKKVLPSSSSLSSTVIHLSWARPRYIIIASAVSTRLSSPFVFVYAYFCRIARAPIMPAHRTAFHTPSALQCVFHQTSVNIHAASRNIDSIIRLYIYNIIYYIVYEYTSIYTTV